MKLMFKKHSVTSAKIKIWREQKEKYAQKHWNLSHRQSFEIIDITKFIKVVYNINYTMIDPNLKTEVLSNPYYDLKYLLWAQDNGYLLRKNIKPTKEHYFAISDDFKLVNYGTDNSFSLRKINSAKMHSLIKKNIIKPINEKDLAKISLLI